MTDLKYWIGFNLVPGIGPAGLRSLLEHFGDLKSAWQAEPRELRRAGLDRRSLESPISTRKEISLEEEETKVAQAGAKAITWEDENLPPAAAPYPQPAASSLREGGDPPPR